MNLALREGPHWKLSLWSGPPREAMCVRHTDTKNSSLSPEDEAHFSMKTECVCLGGENHGPQRSCLSLFDPEPGSLSYFCVL